MIKPFSRSGWQQIGTWLLLLTLCACATPDLETEAQLNYFQQFKMQRAYASAEKLVQQGQAIEAAQELWQAAAKFPPPSRQEMQIQAATILHNHRHSLQAYRYLKNIKEEALSPQLLLKKRLLTASFYKKSRQSRKIIRALPYSLLSYGSKPEQVDAWLLIGDAWFDLNEIPAGILSLLARNKQLPADKRHNNIEHLWQRMLNSDPDQLQLYAAQEQTEAVAAWLRLALLVTPQEINRARLLSEFRQWTQDHPQWPLPPSAEQTLAARWNYLDFKPQKVAMLLPLSGRYGKVGRAILAGFNDTHQQHSSSNNWSVATYNTDQKKDIHALYQRIIREQQADIVIGPILKHNVAALVAGGALATPVLALNYLRDTDTQVRGEFFQFGLLPEDEARQMARRMWNDEHRAIVALSSDNAWGRRIYTAFAQEYETLGGDIREMRYYNPEYADYSNIIKPLFKLDESQEKIDDLKWLLGNRVIYKPGLRDDISAVALFVNHKEAVLIYPQLKYHYVDRIPSYSTSHAYDPNPQKQSKRDLQGLIYCDIPFIVERHAMQSTAVQQLDSEYWRLYAMGADAYTLAQTFRRMDLSGLRVDGLTGNLHMDDQRRLFRTLLWARLSASGMPVPLAPIN